LRLLPIFRASLEIFYLFIFSQGEGVAYRGRVLVELATTLNEDIKQATGPLASEDIIAAQVGGSSLNNV